MKLLGIAIIFLLLSAVSYGQLVTIQIEATVNYLNDYYNLLQGNVALGSIITGTYTYDTSMLDTNPSSAIGDYVYYNLPYGITLSIGEITFKSEPQNIVFKIGITNASPGQLFNDSYGIRSFYNSSIFDGIQVSELSWVLVDFSNTALSNTVLPTNAPILANWNGDNSLYIGGGIGGTAPCYDKIFFITANVTSAVLIPEPISILVFGFGLLVLRKQK